MSNLDNEIAFWPSISKNRKTSSYTSSYKSMGFTAKAKNIIWKIRISPIYRWLDNYFLRLIVLGLIVFFVGYAIVFPLYNDIFPQVMRYPYTASFYDGYSFSYKMPGLLLRNRRNEKVNPLIIFTDSSTTSEVNKILVFNSGPNIQILNSNGQVINSVELNKPIFQQYLFINLLDPLEENQPYAKISIGILDKDLKQTTSRNNEIWQMWQKGIRVSPWSDFLIPIETYEDMRTRLVISNSTDSFKIFLAIAIPLLSFFTLERNRYRDKKIEEVSESIDLLPTLFDIDKFSCLSKYSILEKEVMKYSGKLVAELEKQKVFLSDQSDHFFDLALYYFQKQNYDRTIKILEVLLSIFDYDDSFNQIISYIKTIKTAQETQNITDSGKKFLEQNPSIEGYIKEHLLLDENPYPIINFLSEDNNRKHTYLFIENIQTFLILNPEAADLFVQIIVKFNIFVNVITIIENLLIPDFPPNSPKYTHFHEFYNTYLYLKIHNQINCRENFPPRSYFSAINKYNLLNKLGQEIGVITVNEEFGEVKKWKDALEIDDSLFTRLKISSLPDFEKIKERSPLLIIASNQQVRKASLDYSFKELLLHTDEDEMNKTLIISVPLPISNVKLRNGEEDSQLFQALLHLIIKRYAQYYIDYPDEFLLASRQDQMQLVKMFSWEFSTADIVISKIIDQKIASFPKRDGRIHRFHFGNDNSEQTNHDKYFHQICQWLDYRPLGIQSIYLFISIKENINSFQKAEVKRQINQFTRLSDDFADKNIFNKIWIPRDFLPTNHDTNTMDLDTWDESILYKIFLDHISECAEKKRLPYRRFDQFFDTVFSCNDPTDKPKKGYIARTIKSLPNNGEPLDYYANQVIVQSKKDLLKVFELAYLILKEHVLSVLDEDITGEDFPFIYNYLHLTDLDKTLKQK